MKRKKKIQEYHLGYDYTVHPGKRKDCWVCNLDEQAMNVEPKKEKNE